MHNQGMILWAGGGGKNEILQGVGGGGVDGEGLVRVLEDQSFFFY